MECSFKRGKLFWSGVLKEGSYCGVDFKRGKLLWSVVSKEGGYCGVGF